MSIRERGTRPVGCASGMSAWRACPLVPWGNLFTAVSPAPVLIRPGHADILRFQVGSFGSILLVIGRRSSPPRPQTISRRLAAHRTMGRSTRSSDLVQEDSQPSWDTTPIFMRAWLDALPEYLEKIDPNFVSWWSQGYVLDRNSTVCGPTIRHTVALRDDSVHWTVASLVTSLVTWNPFRHVYQASTQSECIFKWPHFDMCRGLIHMSKRIPRY